MKLYFEDYNGKFISETKFYSFFKNKYDIDIRKLGIYISFDKKSIIDSNDKIEIIDLLNYDLSSIETIMDMCVGKQTYSYVNLNYSKIRDDISEYLYRFILNKYGNDIRVQKKKNSFSNDEYGYISEYCEMTHGPHTFNLLKDFLKIFEKSNVKLKTSSKNLELGCISCRLTMSYLDNFKYGDMFVRQSKKLINFITQQYILYNEIVDLDTNKYIDANYFNQIKCVFATKASDGNIIYLIGCNSGYFLTPIDMLADDLGISKYELEQLTKL